MTRLPIAKPGSYSCAGPKGRCPRKPNRPPGERAQAEAAKLRGDQADGVVVDLETYARIARVAGR